MSVDTLVAAGVATLHEAAGRRGLLRDVRLISGPPFAGEAVTVRLPAGDNLGIHAALNRPGGGRVLCIASGGAGTYGAIGELIGVAARVAGLAAILLDDTVRDVALLGTGPSIAARSVSAQGTIKSRYTDLDGPIALGGVLIEPGDWVIGDADGVVVVPRDRLEAVLAAAVARTAREDGIRTRLEAGATTAEVLGLTGKMQGGGGS